MIPYITYRERNSKGDLNYYILQKEFPHYLAVITYVPVDGKVVPSVPITAHNLWVTFAGTIRGNIIPSYKDVLDQIKDEMGKMALWYYENRIQTKPKKYKKWRLSAHKTT